MKSEDEGDSESQRLPVLSSASAAPLRANNSSSNDPWRRAYSRGGTKAVLLDELRVYGGVACAVQLVVTLVIPGVWYAKFYSLDSRLLHVPIVTWGISVLVGGLGLSGLVLLRSLLLALHSVAALSLGAALGAYDTGLYLVMADRCDRAQSASLGCSACTCAATNTCTRAALRAGGAGGSGGGCSGCKAWSTDVCAQVNAGLLPYMGLVMLVMVAVPAVFSLRVLMRLEKSQADLASRVLYARALVSGALQRLQGGGVLGLHPRVLVHMMTTLVRHGGRGDRTTVRSCCEVLQVDPRALELELELEGPDLEGVRGGDIRAPAALDGGSSVPPMPGPGLARMPMPMTDGVSRLPYSGPLPHGAADWAVPRVTLDPTGAAGSAAPPPVTSIAALRAAHANTTAAAAATAGNGAPAAPPPVPPVPAAPAVLPGAVPPGGGGGGHLSGGSKQRSFAWQPSELESDTDSGAVPSKPPPKPPPPAAPQPAPPAAPRPVSPAAPRPAPPAALRPESPAVPQPAPPPLPPPPAAANAPGKVAVTASAPSGRAPSAGAQSAAPAAAWAAAADPSVGREVGGGSSRRDGDLTFGGWQPNVDRTGRTDSRTASPAAATAGAASTATASTAAANSTAVAAASMLAGVSRKAQVAPGERGRSPGSGPGAGSGIGTAAVQGQDESPEAPLPGKVESEYEEHKELTRAAMEEELDPEPVRQFKTPKSLTRVRTSKLLLQ